MTKEETKRRLNCLEADCKNLGTEISILKAALAEAEKLEELDKLLEKPKHGDFGIDFDKAKKGTSHFPVIVVGSNIIFKDGSTNSLKDEDKDGVITWLGNVFDLMKGWSEPFEHWHSEKGRNYDTDSDLTIVMRIDNCHPDKIWIGTCGNSAWYSRQVSEEIHNALGHAIAELKRKENK